AVVVLGEPPVPGAALAPVAEALAAMLETALTENPPEKVVIVAHGANPRLLRDKLAAAASGGATVFDRAVDPWPLFERASRVYSAGGEIGFLALAAGLPVLAFDDAFYTGWGLTSDARGERRRPFSRTIDEVFAAYCLIATRHCDPFHERRATFAEIVELLSDW